MHNKSGTKGLFPYERRILSLHEVLELIESALYKEQPLSISRFGHAEITSLNWPRKRKNLTEFVAKNREYLGATESPKRMRGKLLQALQTTDIVGLLSQEEHPRFAEETQYMLTRLNWEPQLICSPFFPHQCIRNKKMWELLHDFRVVLVGRRAHEAKPYFQANASQIVNTLNIEGLSQVNSTLWKLQKTQSEWDIALVSAGIPATVLCPILARSTGRIAIDFGHAMDIVIDSSSFNYNQLVANYYTHKTKR